MTVPSLHQPLNAADRAMLLVDRSLRDLGQAGFETQTLVWLGGRLDAAHFRQALERFAACQPVVNARLVVEGAQGRPVWSCATASPWPLQETVLSSVDPQAVLDHAGRLMSQPSDLTVAPPLRAHLLHLPDRRDVLLLHYNHTLMDHSAVVHVLREIDRAWCEPHGSVAAPLPAGDPVLAYLRRFPAAQRRQRAQSYAEELQPLRRGAVRMGNATQAGTTPGEVGMTARCLDAGATAAVQRRVQALGGMPSLSMTILASAFRAVGRLAGARQGRTDFFHAGIGVDLGLRGRHGPLLGNLMSMVSLMARAGDLAERDALVRQLSAQLRHRIANGADLGMLRFATTFARRPRQAHWIVDAWLRYAFSLWYAYFGPLDPGAHFCGADVQCVYSVGPCWPAIGVTLLVNQFRGRLQFQVTYSTATVSRARAQDFLDLVVDDIQ
jgi:hypothetical protein